MRPRAIAEHPLPFTMEAAREIQDDNPMFRPGDDGYMNPDELAERHVHEWAGTRTWSIFEMSIYGLGGNVYAWNRLGGYGLVMGEEEMASLAAALSEVA